jgi:hypothetical protein
MILRQVLSSMKSSSSTKGLSLSVGVSRVAEGAKKKRQGLNVSLTSRNV